MAAAGTEIHSFFSNNIYSSLPLCFEEIFVILSQGSFSFGRYADDSTAWEKKSVFTYNRRQDELEKIKALGVVAQKKAFFDEFFKNIRLVKENAKENRHGTNAAIVEKERKLSNANQIQISDSLCSLNDKEPFCQEVKDYCTEDNDATIKEGTKGCSNIVPVENSFEEASVSRCVERKSIASGKVKQTTNRTIKNGTVSKDKENIASTIKTKAKVQIITTQDGIKSKPNPSLCRQASVKVNKSVISGKENTPNAVRSISRQIIVSHSSIPRLSGLSKSDNQGSSSSSSSFSKTEAKPSSKGGKQETELLASSSTSSSRKTEAKPCLKRTGQEKELPVQIPSTQVTGLGSSSFSSRIRKTEAKPSLKRTKQEKELPVQIPSAKVTRLVSSSASSSIRKTEAKPFSKRTDQRTELPEKIPSAKVTRLVSSSASSSIRKTEAKPFSKRTDQRTELPEKIHSAQVTKMMSSSASSSIRKTEAKASSKRTNKETELPGKIPSAQVTRLVSTSASSSSRKTEAKPSSRKPLKKQSFLSKIPTLK